MVFSIIFNTPFAVFINRTRGADRFDSLLSQLGLENRICANVEDVDHVISTPINWERVNQKLSSLIEDSKRFGEFDKVNSPIEINIYNIPPLERLNMDIINFANGLSII